MQITGSLLTSAQNKRDALQITSGRAGVQEPHKRYCEKQPLLRYPPGRSPLETWNEWRRHI